MVVRDATGDPVVIANAPLLDDGTPMPTRYWLVGPDAVRRVGRLEAGGGVDEAEATVDPAELVRAHDRYAADRDLLVPEGHVGPLPSGGVGGTRTGVKCLHAHYAWYLAGGPDPVGRWVAERLADEDRIVVVSLDATEVRVTGGAGWSEALPVAPTTLWSEGLGDRDPPAPADLTNALGHIDDVLADLVRRRSELVDVTTAHLSGPLARTLARVELGRDDAPDTLELTRDQLEEVFRTVATESSEDRAFNPGLPPEHVQHVVGAACVAVGLLRRFHLDGATYRAETSHGRGR